MGAPVTACTTGANVNRTSASVHCRVSSSLAPATSGAAPMVMIPLPSVENVVDEPEVVHAYPDGVEPQLDALVRVNWSVTAIDGMDTPDAYTAMRVVVRSMP